MSNVTKPTTIGGIQVEFPYEPYSSQLSMARKPGITPSFNTEKISHGEKVESPLEDENVEKDGNFHVVPCIGGIPNDAAFDEHASDLSDEEIAACQMEDDQSVPILVMEE